MKLNVTKRNEPLAEHQIKNEVDQLLAKCKHRNDIHEHKNSTKSEPRKLVLNFSEKLDLRRSNEYASLQNLSIYYNWKNTRQQYKNKYTENNDCHVE